MKNVLIMGATSELAQAIVQRYAREGWSLSLAALQEDGLNGIAENLSATGFEVESFLFDATDFESHAGFYESLPVQPDTVICCFGYLGNQTATRTEFDEVRKTIDINLTGMVSFLNVVAEKFARRGYGRIAAISSVAGVRGKQGNYVYGAAKGALTVYLSGLRNRLHGNGVHVMTVMPGFCHTSKLAAEKFPSALVAEPEQVAEAVFKGLRQKKNVVYVLPVWRWIMALVRYMPEPVFQRLAYSRFHY